MCTSVEPVSEPVRSIYVRLLMRSFSRFALFLAAQYQVARPQECSGRNTCWARDRWRKTTPLRTISLNSDRDAVPCVHPQPNVSVLRLPGSTRTNTIWRLILFFLLCIFNLQQISRFIYFGGVSRFQGLIDENESKSRGRSERPCN